MTALIDGFNGWFRRYGAGRMEGDEESSTTTRMGGSGDQEPVSVWTAAHLMEAQIVQGRLASEGIPATLRGESLGHIYGLTAGRLASTEVLVPAPLADKARRILEIDEMEADDEPAASGGGLDPSV